MPNRMKHVSLEEIQKISLKKNGKPLTMKQALFIQEYAKTGNASLSARNAYPEQKDNTARQMGNENLGKPAIQNVFLQIMEDEGLTDKYLVGKIKEGIEENERNFEYIKLAFQLRGRLQNVSVNLSHTIRETRRRYDLD